MIGEKFTVKEVVGTEKPAAQIEQEVLEQHAEKQEQQLENQIEQHKPEEVEIEDGKLLEVLSRKLNKPLSSLDDLIQKEIVKEELPEDVDAFLKYKKETGRSIDDFIKLNRDYDAMDPDDLLFEYLKVKEEGLDEEDIMSMIREYDIDENFDEEKEIKKKKREKNKTLNEAKQFFKNQKEQYKVPLVSSPVSVPDEIKEQLESYNQYIQSAKTVEEQTARKREVFEQKSNELFSPGFKGFEFKVKVGEEEKGFVFSPGSADELKSLQSTPLNFINRFMDENGMIKDAVGYHKGLAVAMNPEKFAQYFIDQGIALAIENADRNAKNINMSTRPAPTPMAKNGLKVQEVKSPNPGASYTGGLKIKSAKIIP